MLGRWIWSLTSSVALPAVLGMPCLAEEAPSGHAVVKIDCAKTRGELSPYVFGSMAGPGFDDRAATLLKDAGFKLVEVNVPFPPRPAREGPAKFDLADLDRAVELIRKIGAEPLPILSPDRKPQDLDRFAEYVRAVAAHLQEKFGKTGGVRVWRFSNEPDLDVFWHGTRLEWCETYAAWARALKEVDAQFLVGGFSFCAALREIKPGRGPGDPPPDPPTTLGPFAREALDSCRDNGVPVDWFSFHAYGPVTYDDFHLQAKVVAGELAKYPKLSPIFGTPRLANDEWNIKVGDAWSGEYDPVFDSVTVAAHNILSLIEMVEQGLWLSIRYGGTTNAPAKESGMPERPGKIRGDLSNGHDFPLTDGKGQGKPGWFAFKGFNLLSTAPVLLETEGGDHVNLGVCAGKSADVKTVVVVLSNYDVEGAVRDMLGPKPIKKMQRRMVARALEGTGAKAVTRYGKFSIAVEGLGDKGRWERLAVDSRRKLEAVESGSWSGGRVALEGAMECPSVQVWVLRGEE